MQCCNCDAHWASPTLNFHLPPLTFYVPVSHRCCLYFIVKTMISKLSIFPRIYSMILHLSFLQIQMLKMKQWESWFRRHQGLQCGSSVFTTTNSFNSYMQDNRRRKCVDMHQCILALLKFTSSVRHRPDAEFFQSGVRLDGKFRAL